MFKTLKRFRPRPARTPPLEPEAAPPRLGVKVLAEDGPPTVRLPGPILVGSAADCDLVLEHPALAPRHVEIYRQRDLWWVRHLGGDRPTVLDEESIDAAPLGEAATLRLGDGGPVLRLLPE